LLLFGSSTVYKATIASGWSDALPPGIVVVGVDQGLAFTLGQRIVSLVRRVG